MKVVLDESKPGAYNVIEAVIPSSQSAEGRKHYALEFICPCGCGRPGYLPLKPASGEAEPETSPYWTWDGNKVQPTLSPSILRTHGCRFHGFLRSGHWESAGDGPGLASDVYVGTPDHPVEPVRDLR